MIFSFAQIFSWLIAYKYLILFPITVLEGPIITVIAGFFSSLGIFNLLIAYLVVVAGDLAGDSLYYAIGRYGRERFVARWGKYIGLNINRVVKMEQQFNRRGQSILIWGKISHVFGAIILVSAGIVKVKYRDFIFYNFLATLPKAAIFILTGFYFGQAYARIYQYFDWTVLIMFSLGVASIIVYLVIKKYIDKTYQID